MNTGAEKVKNELERFGNLALLADIPKRKLMRVKLGRRIWRPVTKP